MNLTPHKSADESVAAIATLDLDPLKIKLMDAEEGPGWSRLKADQMEVEYKRFLILLAKYPEQTIAPSKDVDKFWHAHILDTLKYAQDCDAVFGYFLHHFPYFGMRGAEDAANLVQAALTSAQLYEQEFGATVIQPQASTGYCGATSASPAMLAYCGATSASPATSAYCGATSASPATSAYCGATSVSPAAPAYCGATQASSYCGATSAATNSTSGQTAYCGMSNMPAYCGQPSAYPGKATSYGSKINSDAYDTSSDHADKMQSHIRPTLPA